MRRLAAATTARRTRALSTRNGNIIISLLRTTIDRRICRNNYKIQFRFGRRVRVRLRFDKISLYAINVYAYITQHAQTQKRTRLLRYTPGNDVSRRAKWSYGRNCACPISSAARHHDKLARILDQSTIYATRTTVVEIFSGKSEFE